MFNEGLNNGKNKKILSNKCGTFTKIYCGMACILYMSRPNWTGVGDIALNNIDNGLQKLSLKLVKLKFLDTIN